MARTRIFVSFDYDHDSGLKEMFVGQSRHPDTPFEVADHSLKQAVRGDWTVEARERIRRSEQVVVLCGHHTHLANGIAWEVRIAQEERKPYFLLCGYRDGVVTRPTTALSTDKLYEWTWPNVAALLRGGR